MKKIMATHEGILKIGANEFPVAVLEDGTRLLTGKGILAILGRPYKGQYKNELPAFIRGTNLVPFISDDVRSLLVPIEYKSSVGGRPIKGFKAELLPDICDIYIEARKRKILTPLQAPIAEKCEIIIRALAKTGITALIDEATGYQEIRDRKALQAILEKYLRKEFAAWAKRFPDEFYREMFRLRDWKWVGLSVKRPQVVGKYTNDIVYERLAPKILEELQKLNPKDDKGHRKAKHHQWLTEDIGNPALTQHIHAVIGFMRASNNWATFYRLINRAFPKKNQQLEFIFEPEK